MQCLFETGRKMSRLSHHDKQIKVIMCVMINSAICTFRITFLLVIGFVSLHAQSYNYSYVTLNCPQSGRIWVNVYHESLIADDITTTTMRVYLRDTLYMHLYVIFRGLAYLTRMVPMGRTSLVNHSNMLSQVAIIARAPYWTFYTYRKTSNISRILGGNKIVDNSYLHSQLNNWLQWIERRQLQEDTRSI